MRSNIIRNSTDIKRIINSMNNFVIDNIDKLDEMDKFLERYLYKLPNLKQEKTDNLNRPISITEIEI